MKNCPMMPRDAICYMSDHCCFSNLNDTPLTKHQPAHNCYTRLGVWYIYTSYGNTPLSIGAGYPLVHEVQFFGILEVPPDIPHTHQCLPYH